MESLPPRSAENVGKERQYRTSLKPAEYLLLEQEALERGLTPYKLTQHVMSLYVNGQLTEKEESQS